MLITLNFVYKSSLSKSSNVVSLTVCFVSGTSSCKNKSDKLLIIKFHLICQQFYIYFMKLMFSGTNSYLINSNSFNFCHFNQLNSKISFFWREIILQVRARDGPRVTHNFAQLVFKKYYVKKIVAVNNFLKFIPKVKFHALIKQSINMHPTPTDAIEAIEEKGQIVSFLDKACSKVFTQRSLCLNVLSPVNNAKARKWNRYEFFNWLANGN